MGSTLSCDRGILTSEPKKADRMITPFFESKIVPDRIMRTWVIKIDLPASPESAVSNAEAGFRMTSENTDEPSPIELPHTGVLLGIDYGTKRVGVAVCDRDQKFSSPLYNYQRQGIQPDTRFFKSVADEYRPVGMVIGLPIHLSGDESEKSREARKYAVWLSQCTGLPFSFQDERFSSFQAEQLMTAASLTKKQRKDRIDKLAAQILLQTFLESRITLRTKSASPPDGIEISSEDDPE